MAFTWSTLNKGTEVTKDQISEVKTNIDTVRSLIGLTPWTWTNVPVTIGNEIQNVPIQEIRNALDLTSNQNVCSSDHLTYNNPFYETNLAAEHTILLGAQSCGQLCSIYWAPNYTTIRITDYVDNLATLGGCATVNSNFFEAYQSNYLRWKFYSVNSYE